MELKFYLNKFLKVDRIEDYTLDSLKKLKDFYDGFLEKTNGIDPDFPMMNFGSEGQSITKGKTNVSKLNGDSNDDGPMLTQEQIQQRAQMESIFNASKDKGFTGSMNF